MRGGGVPLPTGCGVWGGGYAPSPEIFFQSFIIKWRVLVDFDVLNVPVTRMLSISSI